MIMTPLEITQLQCQQLKTMGQHGWTQKARLSGRVEMERKADQLRVRMLGTDWTLEYRQTQAGPDQMCVLPFRALQRLAGTREEAIAVLLEQERVRVSWKDHGIPQLVRYDCESPLEGFPECPQHWEANPRRLLTALHDAVETAAPESTRYALDHLRLRGADGQIAASDGYQLLLQSGFLFPWSDSVLVPAVRLLTSPLLRQAMFVEIGRTSDWIVLRCQPWTLWLKILPDARYPQGDDLASELNRFQTTLTLEIAEADYLRQAIKHLPLCDHARQPITLDLQQTAIVRTWTGEGEPPMEIVLPMSQRQGAEVQLAVNRKYLSRALRMGFQSLAIGNPESAMGCVESERRYLWAPLEASAVIPAHPQAVQVSASPRTNSIERRTSVASCT